MKKDEVMKIKFFSVVVFSLMMFNVYGQSEKGNRFSILFSPQLSWMKSNHNAVNSNGNMFGYDFGFAYDHFFDKNYAFSTGIVINTTGGKLTYRDGVKADVGGELIQVTDLDYKLKYVEIPFGLKLMTKNFRRIRYYTEMGMFMQFNIKARNENSKSLKEEVNFFDLGYHLGGGVEYSVGGDTYLLFGLKYSSGFVDVTDNNTISDKTNLQRFEFRFGIVF